MGNVGASTSRGVALLLVIFVLGMVAGGATFYLGQRSVDRPPARRGPGGAAPLHPLERLSRDLDLDAEQQREIRALMDRHRTDLEALLEQSRLEIRDVLTEEQREAFDRMRPPDRGPGGHPPGGPQHGKRPPPHGKRPPPHGKRPPPHGKRPPGDAGGN